MKKSIVLLAILVLLFALPVSAYATNEYYSVGGTMENVTTGSMEVTGHINSSCVVLIPSSIVAEYSGTTTHLTFCDISLEEGYQISVYVTNLNENNYFAIPHMTRENKFGQCIVYSNTRSNYLTQADPLLAYIDEYFNGLDRVDMDFTVYLTNGFAGNYSGTMQYEIRIEPIAG